MGKEYVAVPAETCPTCGQESEAEEFLAASQRVLRAKLAEIERLQARLEWIEDHAPNVASKARDLFPDEQSQKTEG